MSYRNFRVQVCLRLLVITVCLTGFIYFTVVKLDAIKAFFTGVFTAIATVSLFFYIDRVNMEVSGFLSSILNEDYTNKYSDTKKGRSFNEMYTAFNSLNAKMNQFSMAQETQFLFVNTLIQQLQTGILSIDQRERVKLMNENMKSLLGVTNLVNLKDLDHKHPTLTERIRNLKSGQSALVKVTIDGQLRQLSLRATTFTLRHQYHQLVSVHDIKGELDQQEMESWHKLIRVLTHEIMNSIAPITSLSHSLHQILNNQQEAVTDQQLSEQLLTGLEAIKGRSSGLMKFTKDYRSLTRIPMPSIRTVDGQKFLSTTIRLFESTLPEHIKLSLLLPEERFQLQIDSDLISQAMINILKNAVEAIIGSGQKNGIITVEAVVDTHLSLRLTNNGGSMSEEIKEKIFIPFFTSKPEGSGVGLSVVKQILQLHQAIIGVECKDDETTFTINF